MPISPARAHHRAKIASIKRCIATGERQPNDPELLEAQRNLAAAGLEEHVARVIADAPELTAAQRDRICAILQSGGSDAA